MSGPVRLGVLGTGRIADIMLEAIAGRVPRLSVDAVGSRTSERATAFAARHGIAVAHRSYAALVADPAIDVVYNALPNALHVDWTIAALEQGKAVICEKPLSANADEARRMAAAADRAGLLLMDAMHYRYHPFARRLRAIVDSGRLGSIREIRTRYRIPGAIFADDDIRYDLALGGGAMIDPGVYCIDLLRWITGEEPAIVAVRADLRSAGIDMATQVDLRFPGGMRAQIEASLGFEGHRVWNDLEIVGTQGALIADGLYAPNLGNELIVDGADGRQREQLPTDPTFPYMFEAMVAALLDGAAIETPGAASIGTMAVIDAIYRTAGMAVRGTEPQVEKA